MESIRMPSPSTSPTPPPPGPWGSVLRVFWEPGRVLAAQATRTTIAPPYLLAMLVMAAVTLVMAPTLMKLQLAEATRQLQAQGPAAQQQAAQAMQAMETFRTMTMAFGVVAATATPWLYGLLYALVLWVLGALRGGPGTFRQYFATVGYALLPVLVLGGLLKLPLMLGVTSMSQVTHVGFGPVLLFPEAGGALLGLLGALDLLNLWTVALVTIGFAAVHRIAPGRAAYAGVILVVLQIAVAAGISSLSSGLTPGL